MVMNNELNNSSNMPEDPANNLPSDHIRQIEAYKFLKTAYSAGINIIIEGVTYSGRTSFLQNLINTSEDNQSTIFLTNYFEADTPKATQMQGDDPLWLIHQARRMNPSRIVMDDLYISDKEMESIVSGALTGTQFISTGYVDYPYPVFTETDSLSARYIEHPFELRAHVSLSRNNAEGKFEFNILSVSQIIHQKLSRLTETGGKYSYDSTRNHLLFEGDKKVADPTRTLRRKIGFKQRTNSSKSESSSSLKNDPNSNGPSANTFVSLSPQEKAKLLEHRAVLREHFQTQSETLQEHFKEIENLLARF
jgi:hypothetical protein